MGIVERDGGTIQADYNGFFNPETTNYIGVAAPAHDLNGGAQTNPNFAGPLPTKSFDMDEVAVWMRQLSVTQILTSYRARYTPGQGSAFIDAGDPAGGAGNDIGAVGAGVANAADRFGKVGDPTDPGGGPGDPVDSDGDGLPDDWETQFGLNPNSATGDDGASGNPDQDDANNLAEYQQHSHPRGVTALTRYFAEGSQSTFFETTIDLVNPDASQRRARAAAVPYRRWHDRHALRARAGAASCHRARQQRGGARGGGLLDDRRDRSRRRVGADDGVDAGAIGMAVTPRPR